MATLIRKLINDDAGFIVSAELVLVATIGVLAMIVGLAEVSHNINEELEDVGSAFASINQSFHVNGASGHKASTGGNCFTDKADYCDGQYDISGCTNLKGE